MSKSIAAPETISAVWRRKLAEAQGPHAEHKTHGNEAEWRRVLGIFTAVVVRGVNPLDVDDVAGQEW